VDFKELNTKIFGKIPENRFLGNYSRCYLGHANDDSVRSETSSGGMVTQLLIFALENGIIDGALVTRMKKDNPLRTEPFIARTRGEIILASKSKYCPASPDEALKLILRERGRFAVIGLPCHIHGIRKAEENVKGLKEKIVLHLGLICSHAVNFFGTALLLEKLTISSDQIAEIAYRGRGWPGSMSIRLNNDSTQSLLYVGNWNSYGPVFSSFFFTPRRCLMCPDETNELADISFGDAWIPELKNERNGESVIVVRTNAGAKILDMACAEGAIFMKALGHRRVECSQAGPLKFKKKDFDCRLAMIKSKGEETPNFNFRLIPHFSFVSFARNLFVLLNLRISESKNLKSLLVGIPLPIYRLYYGIYKLGLAF
jgi:coenzyme F420 hydrogenase subunit beta